MKNFLLGAAVLALICMLVCPTSRASRSDLRVDGITGAVDFVFHGGSFIWVGTERGIYRISGDEPNLHAELLIPRPVGRPTTVFGVGPEFSYTVGSRYVWFWQNSFGPLYRASKSDLTPPQKVTTPCDGFWGGGVSFFDGQARISGGDFSCACSEDTAVSCTTPKLAGDLPEAIEDLVDLGDHGWFSSGYEVVRWAHGSTRKVSGLSSQGGGARGPIRSIEATRGALWVGSIWGLFRISEQDRNLNAQKMRDIGPVYGLAMSGDRLWIGASQGVFICSGECSQGPEPVEGIEGRITGVTHSGDADWLSTDRGALYQVSIGAQKPALMFQGSQTGPINRVQILDGNVIGIASDELITWNGHSFAELTHPRGGLFRDSIIFADKLWVSSTDGLFRMDSDNPSQLHELNLALKDIKALASSGSTILIGDTAGLLRFRGDTSAWHPILEFKQIREAEEHQPVVIEWTVDGLDMRASAESMDQEATVFDSDGQRLRTLTTQYLSGNRFESIVADLPEGKYTLSVQATDLTGVKSSPSQTKFRVGRNPWTAVGEVLVNSISITFIIHFLSFWVLLLAARASDKSFTLLTDSRIPLFGVYLGFALKYLTPVRLFLFERYFRALSSRLEALEEYVPIAVHNGSHSVASDGIWDELQRLIEVQGRGMLLLGSAGAGKTTLVHHLMKSFTSMSAKEAKAKYGFIPILIDVRTVEADSAVTMAWRALRSLGFTLPDEGVCESMLEAGDSVMVLDGLNELSNQRTITTSLAVNRWVRVLATSQMGNLDRQVPIYKLPEMTAKLAAQIFLALTGYSDEESQKHIDARMFSEVKSGYDLRLLAALAKAGTAMPSTRVGLYEHTINEAISDKGRREELCRFSWNLWKDAKRTFTSEDLSTQIIQDLRGHDIVVMRGTKFEFRHDLLLGYLAATWAVRFSATVEALRNRLDDPAVWDLSPADQDLVFRFVAELSSSGTSALEQLAAIANKNLELRYRLAVAVSNESQQRRLTTTVHISRE